MGHHYKEGDNIKIIKHNESVPIDIQVGLEGRILSVDWENMEDTLYIEVGVGGSDNTWWWNSDEVELIEQSQTSFSDTVRDFILTEPDKVNPPHYKKGSVECIDAIKAATVGKSGFEGYLVGNVIKYVFRYEDKGGVEDLRKASWYLNKLIDERAT